MSYKYTHFIQQNTAPSGTKRIGVYNGNGDKICNVPLGNLTPTAKKKLYSFGLVSDIHLWNGYTVFNPNTKFDNALTHFENEGCSFCIVCGDLTQTGLYGMNYDTTPPTVYSDEQHFAKYKEICDKHTIPVHELMGNHESYYGMPISNNLALLESYTGRGVLSYTVEQESDLFILVGQPKDAWVMSDADFTWLAETLEANKNKRCFVFIHPYIEEDSGDPLDIQENSMFDDIYWGATNKTAFMNLIKQYPNTVLFHGHSHMKFECQEYDVNANYTEKNGFKSVHIPSLGRPRDIDLENMVSVDDNAGSQGYIVDVYDDCVVLNGYNFIKHVPVPLGIYKIDV